MLGLCSDKTYVTITKYDDRDENVDNDKNRDKNDDENAAAGSGSDGLIFNPIMTTWSCGGGSGNDDKGAVATELRPWPTMYIRVGLYI